MVAVLVKVDVADMKLLMELWREYNGDRPSDADFADEARREKIEKIYMEALIPRAAEIIPKLLDEDFAAELAEAAEGNRRIDALEFLLESIGESLEDLTDPDRYGDM